MTMIIAWLDKFGGYLCADSVATHNRPPRETHSSFGELQTEDGITREESAIKVVELPRRILASITGDMESGLSYLGRLEKLLRLTDKSLNVLLDESTPSLSDPPFAAAFIFHCDNEIHLRIFNPYNLLGITLDEKKKVAILGSLPNEHRNIPLDVAYSMSGLSLSAPERLAAVLTALQARPITNNLIKHGIGGVFFGAHLSSSELIWQPEITYICHHPSANEIGLETSINVRVLVADGIGIVITSLSGIPIKAFLPPFPPDRILPSPRELGLEHLSSTSLGTHYGFLNASHPNAIYYTRRELAPEDAPFFRVELRENLLLPHYKLDLLNRMKRETNQDEFNLAVYIDRKDKPIEFSKTFKANQIE